MSNVETVGFENVPDEVNAAWIGAVTTHLRTSSKKPARSAAPSPSAAAVAEALEAAARSSRSAPGAPSQLLESPPVQLDASSTEHLMVLQGEVGAIAGLVDDAGCISSRVRFIASPDATSCVILGVRVTSAASSSTPNPKASPAATAITHFGDAGRSVADTMRHMLYRLCLPAVALDSPCVVEWYLAGGVVNFKYTARILVDIAAALVDIMSTPPSVQAPPRLRHHLRGDFSCFWTENTIIPADTGSSVTSDSKRFYTEQAMSTAGCRIRGLAIDNATGAAHTFDVVVGTRKYPFAHLRGLRFAGENATRCDSDGVHLPCVTPVPLKADGSDTVRVVVEPFTWRALDASIARAPDAAILQWSTTPTMEPPDFCDHIRAAAIFSRVYTHQKIFCDGKAVEAVLEQAPDDGAWRWREVV